MDANELEDGLTVMQSRIRELANAITPLGAHPTTDATGVSVGSLTEAVIGMTAGLVQIAEAIDRLASSVDDKQFDDYTVGAAIIDLSNSVRRGQPD